MLLAKTIFRGAYFCDYKGHHHYDDALRLSPEYQQGERSQDLLERLKSPSKSTAWSANPRSLWKINFGLRIHFAPRV